MVVRNGGAALRSAPPCSEKLMDRVQLLVSTPSYESKDLDPSICLLPQYRINELGSSDSLDAMVWLRQATEQFYSKEETLSWV